MIQEVWLANADARGARKGIRHRRAESAMPRQPRAGFAGEKWAKGYAGGPGPTYSQKEPPGSCATAGTSELHLVQTISLADAARIEAEAKARMAADREFAHRSDLRVGGCLM